MVALALLLGGVIDAGIAAPRATRAVLSVTPQRVLVDQRVSVEVSGVRPGTLVTMTAMTRSGGGTWRSQAVFRADGRGRVDVPRARSLGGTYRGRDAMGLFWSMRLVGSRLPLDEQSMFPDARSRVVVEATTDGRVVASVSLTRLAQAPGVTERDTSLARQGFLGCFYSPGRTARPAPAVLLLGGSEGGLPCGLQPAMLASHGYPTLALGYFAVKGLPRRLERIPLEYFQRALRWLARQRGVAPGKLVVFGVSRGGEAALLLGTVYPNLIHAVASYVGSSVVNGGPYGRPAWTLHGKPVPYVPYLTGGGFGDPDPTDHPQAVIPVEKISGPIFLVSAAMDALWPSSAYASAIVERLRAHHRSDYTSLVYYDAGHGVGTAVPNFPFGTVVPTADGPLGLGGTLSGDAHARADSWPKLLAFLGRLR